VVTSGTVACFAGKIGSGKTSVTRALAQCLNWRRVAFGDCVRAELARRGGNPDVREELQDLGQHLVDTDPVSLCRAVLGAGNFSPGEDLLVDGIRHAAVYRALGEIVKPSQTCLIYLGATDDVRSLRVAERGDAIAGAADHRVEAELATTLPTIADAVVEAGGSFTTVLSDCLDVLGRVGVDETLIASARKHARDFRAL
jgi:cytidylate kinase